jgi:hypothetical protein
MKEQGYSRCHSDHCVYFKRIENGSYIILMFYVDERIVVGSNMHDINVLKNKLFIFFCGQGFGCCKENL